MQTKLCSKCGSPVKAEARFCPTCGTAYIPPSENLTQCSQCSNSLRPGAKFCPVCGKPVSQPAGAAPGSIPPPQPICESEPQTAPQAVYSAPAESSTAQPALQASQAASASSTSKRNLGWKKSVLVGCGCLAALFIAVAVIGVVLYGLYNPDNLLALIYTLTPTSTPTATPNYQATHAAATQIAQTATAAALFVTQTAQASATAGARTATAAAQQTRAAATAAASQTRAAATQLAYQATQQVINDLKQAVQKICQGSGEPGAAHYINKRAFHPILISPDTYPFPDEARPGALNLLELVACVELSQVTTNSLPYTNISTGASGFTCYDKVNVAKITVRAADTGKSIRTSEVRGSRPADPCGQYENFPAGQTQIVKLGGPVDQTQIWQKIKDMVFLELK